MPRGEFDTQELEEKIPTVALLDVDDTLIIGDCTVDPDIDGIEQIKAKFRSEGVLNLDLISALEAANIKDIYLFTDMTLNNIGLLERRALVDVLEESGFTVHGVMTPADCAWDLPQKALKTFAESKDALLPKEIDRLKKEGKTAEAAQLLSKLQQNVDYQTLMAGLELKDAHKPGRAFEESEKALDKPTSLQDYALQSRCAKSFADLQSVLEGMSHVKGKMFQHLVNHDQHRFKKFIVFDDRLDVLESIKQANDTYPKPVDTATVYINNNQKRKPHGEQIKNRASYLNEIRASTVLNNACLVYKTHLEKFIEGERKSNNGDELECEKDKNFVLAKNKLKAVGEMHNTLGKTVGDEQLKAFRAKFIEHRATLEQRRDSWGRWFLRVTATVLSVGIAAAFGIWNVTGRKMTETVEPFLPKLGTGK